MLNDHLEPFYALVIIFEVCGTADKPCPPWPTEDSKVGWVGPPVSRYCEVGGELCFRVHGSGYHAYNVAGTLLREKHLTSRKACPWII